MCSHNFLKVNDVRVCTRCGLTFRNTDGKVMFDRDIANIAKQGRKKRRAKK